MTNQPQNEKNMLDNLVSDLRDDYLDEAPVTPALDHNPPKVGREVRMGGRVPRWAYLSGMGLAGSVLLFVIIALVIQVSKPLASYTNSAEIVGLTATELPLPTFEAPSLPPPPTPGIFPAEPNIPLPIEESPILPEPTEIPLPPTPMLPPS